MRLRKLVERSLGSYYDHGRWSVLRKVPSRKAFSRKACSYSSKLWKPRAIARLDIVYNPEDLRGDFSTQREGQVKLFTEQLVHLSLQDQTTIRVLDEVRHAVPTKGGKIPIRHKNQVSAYLLQRRGAVSTTPCKKCSKDGFYDTCVVSPSCDGAALYFGACANCLDSKGSKQRVSDQPPTTLQVEEFLLPQSDLEYRGYKPV
ncbi:hypothetical protein F9C07_2282912 [Aspergillus flavus]|uniref:Uncharacterized protein n=1 Tax=Aspergillus flavus (strain ATCC 200026 / FGSC A1120 / IAM 13836 / NRRL 3357 / JCM 12722 / SRRC 167) TaxID=332952 RepID=A0A7U2MTA6_ASPFN|nr:hypothetical protein F9C07_2282912 [Aspergillus flavus]